MHPDIPEEQAYFDHALDLRERLDANLDRATTLAVDPKTAAELRRRVGALGVVDPAQAVAFGRIDQAGQRFYIGRGAIWDEKNDLVVVNWQAPVAAPFYIATPQDPNGIDLRRIFRCRDNRILDIEELVFAGLEDRIRTNGHGPGPGHDDDPHRSGDGEGDGGGAPGGDDVTGEARLARHGLVMTDTLLEAIGRERSGELADIVATIQAAQYDVITRDPEQLLIVQGGPGTGKTVVGLHRVSWLLFNRREQLSEKDVLIVGPNKGFIRYISAVLPALGDEAVVQLPLTGLGPRVMVSRVDPVDVRRLKGDRRMLRLVLRAIRNRERVSRRIVEFTVERRRVQFEGEKLAVRARQLAGQPHNEIRRALRSFVLDEVQKQLTPRAAGFGRGDEVDLRGEAGREIDNYLERVWPHLTPQSFLVELFSTRSRLEAAAAGLLTGDEIDLLLLPRDLPVAEWPWALDDIPLLDLAETLLNGPPPTYEHVVVDEAQDLSPMQFESIRRRSRNGHMTVLGDLAQATSPWAPGSWEEVALHLRRDRVATELVELSLGYRLPSEVHEVAMRLLPEIAPRLKRPDPLRSSGHPVTVTSARPEHLGDATVRTVRELLGHGLIGVITSDRDRQTITQALEGAGVSCAPELQSGTPSQVVALVAEHAKGLEFDNVVVVEPAQIAAESPQGLRALFVALTRPTRRLSLVHAETLPKVLGLDSPLPESNVTDSYDGDRSPDAEPAPAAPEAPGGYLAPPARTGPPTVLAPSRPPAFAEPPPRAAAAAAAPGFDEAPVRPAATAQPTGPLFAEPADPAPPMAPAAPAVSANGGYRPDDPARYRADEPGVRRVDDPTRYRADEPGVRRVDDPARYRADEVGGHRVDDPGAYRADEPARYRAGEPGGHRVDEPGRYQGDERGGRRVDEPARYRADEPGRSGYPDAPGYVETGGHGGDEPLLAFGRPAGYPDVEPVAPAPAPSSPPAADRRPASGGYLADPADYAEHHAAAYPEVPPPPPPPADVGEPRGPRTNGVGHHDVEPPPPPPPPPPPAPYLASPAAPASSMVPARPGPTGIDLREQARARPPAVLGTVSPVAAAAPGGDPFLTLDQQMARAVAAQLSEAMRRYVTPALIPLVVEQMAEMLGEEGHPDDG